MTIAKQLVQQGLQQVILDVLEARFSDIPLSLREKLSGISDQTILKDLLKKAAAVPSAGELEKKIPAEASNLSQVLWRFTVKIHFHSRRWPMYVRP